MSEATKATSDPGTPIFGELNSELELPEIDVHDFEWHQVDFPEGPSATQPPEVESAKVDSEQGAAAIEDERGAAQQPAQTNSSATAAHSAAEEATATAVHSAAGEATEKRGGRRRKEE